MRNTGERGEERKTVRVIQIQPFESPQGVQNPRQKTHKQTNKEKKMKIF